MGVIRRMLAGPFRYRRLRLARAEKERRHIRRNSDRLEVVLLEYMQSEDGRRRRWATTELAKLRIRRTLRGI